MILIRSVLQRNRQISVLFLPDDGIARQGERRQNGHEQQPHRRRAGRVNGASMTGHFDLLSLKPRLLSPDRGVESPSREWQADGPVTPLPVTVGKRGKKKEACLKQRPIFTSLTSWNLYPNFQISSNREAILTSHFYEKTYTN